MPWCCGASGPPRPRGPGRANRRTTGRLRWIHHVMSSSSPCRASGPPATAIFKPAGPHPGPLRFTAIVCTRRVAECFTTATGARIAAPRNNDKQRDARAIRHTTSSDESRMPVVTRDASKRAHLSTRVASSRFAPFVGAARGAHAAVGRRRAYGISPAQDGACVTRIGAREMLRMCNATPNPANTSECVPFSSCETGARFDRHTAAHAPTDGTNRPPREVGNACRRRRAGRMRSVHADSSVNQNAPPTRVPDPLPRHGALPHGASGQMAHALLDVGQVSRSTRTAADGRGRQGNEAGRRRNASVRGTRPRPLRDGRATAFH